MRKVIFEKEFSITRDSETSTRFPAGWKGDISHKDFALADAAGAVRLVEGDKGGKAAAREPGRAERPSDPAALLAAIVAVLDPKDRSMFNTDGNPSVKALEAKLGYQINAAERDAAWAQVQQKLNV